MNIKKTIKTSICALVVASLMALPVFAGNSSPANSGTFYVHQDYEANVYQNTDRNVLYAFANGYVASVNGVNKVSGTYATLTISCPQGSRNFTGSGTYRFGGYLSSNTCTFSETLSADRTAIASGSISIA